MDVEYHVRCVESYCGCWLACQVVKQLYYHFLCRFEYTSKLISVYKAVLIPVKYIKGLSQSQ